MALDGVLANIPGLAGYLAQQQFDQRRALGDLQGVAQIAQMVNQQRAQQFQERAQSRLEAQQQEELRRRAEAEGLAKQAYEQFLRPGRTTQTTEMLPDDNITGEPARQQAYTREEKEPDLKGAAGLFLSNPMTAQQGVSLLNTQATIEGRKEAATEAAQARMDQLRFQAQEARARGDQTEALRLELQAREHASRMIAIQTAAAMRPEPAPALTTIMHEGRPVVFDARSGRIIGDAPPSKSLEAGKFTRAQQIVRDVENSPEAKLWKELKPVVETAYSYYNDLKQGKRPISPPEDAGLARTFLRLAFPSRTVSTNKDAMLLIQQAGIPDRALNFLPSVLSGTRLPDAQRDKLMAAISERANRVYQNLANREDRASELMSRMEIDPDIIPDISGRRKRTGSSDNATGKQSSRSVDDLLKQYPGQR